MILEYYKNASKILVLKNLCNPKTWKSKTEDGEFTVNVGCLLGLRPSMREKICSPKLHNGGKVICLRVTSHWPNTQSVSQTLRMLPRFENLEIVNLRWYHTGKYRPEVKCVALFVVITVAKKTNREENNIPKYKWKQVICYNLRNVETRKALPNHFQREQDCQHLLLDCVPEATGN